MRRTILISLIILSPFGFATEDDIYIKPGIPDVDKPDRDGDGKWPDKGDNSCWIATASNMLAAAGYGQGATAQERGDYVYGKLTKDLGTAYGGHAEWAVNYYLYKYAKNANAGIDFQNSIAYTDVTIKRMSTGNLLQSDYDFLISELKRCQYVGLEINGQVGSQDWAHAVTLIGGYGSTPNGNQLAIQDSDRDVGAQYDVYNAWYDANQNWYLSDYANDPWTNVYAYQTLCPGLNKPLSSVMNYDVAWYRNTWDANFSELLPTFQETGVKADAYKDPYWDNALKEVFIGNEYADTLTKSIYLLVDLADRSGQLQDDIMVLDDRGQLWKADSIEMSKDGGQLLYTWKLNYQPGWEKIIFPNTDYYNLDGRIKDWNLSSECSVPAPAAFLPFALALLCRRRKRR